MFNKLILGCSLLLLFVSCGQQQQAKSALKDFMDEELHRDVSYVDFSSVDSTRVISDSLVGALRLRGGRQLRYAPRQEKTLMHIRASYVLQGDTLSTTFYMNKDMQGIVAFKDNH
jgi:hypothetical protein